MSNKWHTLNVFKMRITFAPLIRILHHAKFVFQHMKKSNCDQALQTRGNRAVFDLYLHWEFRSTP